MRRRIFIIIIFIGIGASKLFSQNVLLQDFKCESFDLKYPILWKVDTSDKKYYFYYNSNLGDITVSFYENRNFSEAELKNMLLELRKEQEALPDITVSKSDGTITCFYKYTSEKVKYFVKAIQNEEKMFLISLNWRQDSWEDFKDVLLESFESFKPK